jgi:phthiodiolone/phenolphthiodiolone dimycocerosates ketoreductase
MRTVETAVIIFGDRHLPASSIEEAARAIEASGVVDYLEMSDQLNNFIPPSLWTTDNTPLAEVLPDIDSPVDAFMAAVWAAAAAPKLKVTLATDSIRHGPSELIQSMLTMACLTEGRAMFQVGGGEQKQCRAYGWKRGQGLKRMEDLFRIFHAYWDTDGPIDFEGHFTTLKRAYLGGAKRYRPILWGLGGGPTLVELSTTYCDGFSAAAPCVWASSDEAGERISELKQVLERKGRDPDEFGFGIFCPVLLHEDAARIDAALDNPLVRWMAATYGRITQTDWRKIGIEPPVADGWTYYMNMVPYHETPEFIDEVLTRSTRAIAENGMFWGTPAEVARTLQGYVDAGVNWVLPVDYMPLMLSPEEAPAALERSIEVCAHLKGAAVPA